MPAASDPIQHVVLLVMENHSFDQMLGGLQIENASVDGVDMGSDPYRFNPDLSGNKIYQIPQDEQQVPRDPKHETRFVVEQLANGNSGFVSSYQRNVPGTTQQDRQYIMGYYAPGRLQALHELGRNFTICDRWFSSLPGPTWPNRFFALSGTSSGRVLMPEGIGHPRLREIFAQDQVTLFDRLTEAGQSWRIYFYDFPSSLLLTRQRRPENLRHYERIGAFFDAVRDAGTFPAFAFIEPKYFGADQNDDHPPHNVFKAEKLIADVYNAIRSNAALWASTLLVVVYDEHGGFYDHVEPPAAVPPDEHREEWTFDRLGVRVPALLISPWVGARVEKTVFDHTSLLRYLIDKWGLGPLGARTAQANSIAVAFTENAPRSDTIPFIRVPYTTLIPPDADLEQNDTSNHHEALHAFAAFLAEEKSEVFGDLIVDLARIAGSWVRLWAMAGRVLQRLGAWLGRDLNRVNSRRVDATRVVASRLLDSAKQGAGASGGAA